MYGVTVSQFVEIANLRTSNSSASKNVIWMKWMNTISPTNIADLHRKTVRNILLLFELKIVRNTTQLMPPTKASIVVGSNERTVFHIYATAAPNIQTKKSL